MAFEPHWTSYLSALLTPIVAAIGLLIACRQWRTARDKLKHELFDRRFAIFEAASNLCSSVLTLGSSEGDGFEKLNYKAIEAKWLLNEDISRYIETLCSKSCDLSFINFELEQFCEQYPMARYLSPKLDDIPEEDRQQIISKRRMKEDLVSWFGDQPEVFNEKFSEFLTLKH